MEKTNVMRLLDAKSIPYEAREYDPKITSGPLVAAALGEDPDTVFKTLVTEGPKKEHFVFVIPERGTRFEESRESRAREIHRDDSPKRVASLDGLYPRRLFPFWDEETFSDVPRRDCRTLPEHFRKRGASWLSSGDLPFGHHLPNWGFFRGFDGRSFLIFPTIFLFLTF